jgi:predicted RNA binding protein YcfA (HicA-like mRNA interferase family)
MDYQTEGFQQLASKHGIRFDGFQKTMNGGSLPMFTHPDFGTFVITEGETLDQAITRKQIQFSINHEG